MPSAYERASSALETATTRVVPAAMVRDPRSSSTRSWCERWLTCTYKKNTHGGSDLVDSRRSSRAEMPARTGTFGSAERGPYKRLRGHCAVTAQPLRGHCVATVQPLYSHCAATVRPLYSHYAATVWPLYGHCAATVQQPLCSHCTATVRPLYGHCAATV